MKIAPRLLLSFVIILALLGAIVISMSLVVNSRKQSAEATVLLDQNYKLANQLRQSSDDLTKMARAYVVTSNPIYEKVYYDILAMRNGKLPHPANNDQPYWDFVLAEEKDLPPIGDSFSLIDILNKGKITPEERVLLKEAIKASDKLTIVEERAFGAMHGLFPDELGRLRIHGESDPALAQSMLHNAPYNKYKAAVMRPISQFINITNQRIVAEINDYEAKEDNYVVITAFLVLAALLFVIMAFLHLKKKLINPIIALSDITHNILNGALNKRATVNSTDEIGHLCDAFNRLIEARVKGEVDARNNEKNLLTTLNSIGDALIATDIAGNITQMNPAAEKLSGWRFIEAKGLPFFDVFHILNAQTRELIPNPLQKILKSGHSVSLHDSMTLISKNGPEHQVADSAAPIYNEAKGIIGMVLILHDVTAEYTAHNELHESETRFKTLFENAEVAICNEDLSELVAALEQLRRDGVSNLRQYCEENPQIVWDLVDKIKILQVNSATLKLFKTTSDQNIRDHIHGSSARTKPEVFINAFCALWDKKTAFRSIAQFKTSDGKILDAIISFPIPKSLADLKSIPVSIIDITEHKKLEQRLLRSQKMEVIGELAGGIAHDFNNLLGIVIGNLDLMSRQIEDGTKLHNQLEKAQNAALRGSSLIRRLLNFSHQMPEASSPTNVNSIIRGMEYLIDNSLPSNITVETVLASDLWMTDINMGDFEDVLINFSLNARDAMPDGGRITFKTGNITLDHPITTEEGELAPGEYVEITISDTGTGMSHKVAANIFEPFFTTKNKDKGTGLGLAMVYGFVQRSKGDISVQSEEGVGTTFRIYLPRSQSMADRLRMSVAKPAPEPMPLGTETILVVDDEEELTLISKNILEPLGYKIICTYDADDALTILKEDKTIDLLFTDVVMAGPLSGFDLAEQASALRPNLKILLTSGFTGVIQDATLLKKWDKAIIAKPYRNIDLAKHIRTTLDNKGLRL